MKNFGEFFNDQVENAGCIILSHTGKTSEEKLAAAVALLKEKNQTATIVTAEWSQLDGKAILSAMERKDCLQAELDRLAAETERHHHEHAHEHHHECDDPNCDCHHHEHHEHAHEHHHECDDPNCDCHHHEHHEHAHEHHHECDDPNCDCHHHEHHEHAHEHHHECDDPNCDCHHHEHAHEHHHECDDPNCDCHHHEHAHEHYHECDDPNCDCHHHEHHGHHHHADEVFTSWGVETTKKYTKDGLIHALTAIQNEETYGVVLRAKGIVAGESGWLHFDYVPGEPEVREGCAGVTGRLCVIGCKLNEEALSKLFGM